MMMIDSSNSDSLVVVVIVVVESRLSSNGLYSTQRGHRCTSSLTHSYVPHAFIQHKD